jgi:LAO/AO transport system kinase
VVTGQDVLSRLRGADPRVLPRVVTLVENNDPRGLAALDELYRATGRAHVVGITGPPGVGKSTLTASLVERIRESGRRVAVLAVDPSSPLTGGAVLGDRIRMMARHADPNVFVRSMASRGRQGGLASATAAVVHVLDAAGFPLILVETAGTGQDGTDIASLADTVLVVQSPGLGDGVQAIKSGLLEVGDVVVVNKADQPGTNDALRLLRAGFALGHPRDDRVIPIMATDAISGAGVAELLAAIDDHSTWLDDTGNRSLRRERRARTEVLAGVRSALDAHFTTRRNESGAVQDAIARVVRRELSPHQAVDSIVATLTAP